MYFWNLGRLKQDLASRGLTAAESFRYLVVFLVLASLPVLFDPPDHYNRWKVIAAALNLLIVLAGTRHIYSCNGGAEGRDFLQRYMSLGWVCGVRYLVMFVIPVSIVGGIVYASWFDGDPYVMNEPIPSNHDLEPWAAASDLWHQLQDVPWDTEPFDVIMIAIITPPFYWRIGVHMRDLARPEAVVEPRPLPLEELED